MTKNNRTTSNIAISYLTTFLLVSDSSCSCVNKLADSNHYDITENYCDLHKVENSICTGVAKEGLRPLPNFQQILSICGLSGLKSKHLAPPKFWTGLVAMLLSTFT